MIPFLHDHSIFEMHVEESFDLLPLLSYLLFIDISISFILLFYLTKTHNWILLFDRFPMGVTILKSKFQIESYGLPKFPKPNPSISTSLPCGRMSLVPYDVALTWMLTWHLPPGPSSRNSILDPSSSS